MANGGFVISLVQIGSVGMEKKGVWCLVVGGWIEIF